MAQTGTVVENEITNITESALQLKVRLQSLNTILIMLALTAVILFIAVSFSPFTCCCKIFKRF